METSKLMVKEKIGYGMGDVGCNIIFSTVMLFANYFYTDIFSLAPALVGVSLLPVRVINAVTDLIISAMANRTHSKYGRFHPWLLWMAFPYALFSVLMFIIPGWTCNSKVIHAPVTYFLLSAIYTAINIPYCSLGGVITSDPKERVACRSYHFALMGIATLLLSLALLPIADWFGGEDRTRGYQMAMAVLALIGMCMFLFCFAVVRERIRPAVQTNDDLRVDLKDVWKNDQWVKILLLTLYNARPDFIRMVATMYYVAWIMQQSTQLVTLFTSLSMVGMVIGSMLTKVSADRWYKLKVFFWTNIILAIFSAAFYFFDPRATMMIMVFYFLFNTLHQVPSPLHWSLMADVDDYGGWRTGRHIAGISFSGNLFFLKLGLTIARAMVGFLLSWYGYDAGAKAQSDSAINGVMLLFTIMSGIGYLITAGAVRSLKADHEFMQQIQTNLKKCRINYRELNEYHGIRTAETIREA